MTRRKNVKRIDPRYFLNETVNRNDDGSRLEERDRRRGDSTQGHMPMPWNSDDPQYPGKPFMYAAGSALDLENWRGAVYARKNEDDGTVIAGRVDDLVLDIARGGDIGSGYHDDFEKVNRIANQKFPPGKWLVTNWDIADRDVGVRDVEGMNFDKVMKAIDFVPLEWNTGTYEEIFTDVFKRERGY